MKGKFGSNVMYKPDMFTPASSDAWPTHVNLCAHLGFFFPSVTVDTDVILIILSVSISFPVSFLTHASGLNRDKTPIWRQQTNCSFVCVHGLNKTTHSHFCLRAREEPKTTWVNYAFKINPCLSLSLDELFHAAEWKHYFASLCESESKPIRHWGLDLDLCNWFHVWEIK